MVGNRNEATTVCSATDCAEVRLANVRCRVLAHQGGSIGYNRDRSVYGQPGLDENFCVPNVRLSSADRSRAFGKRISLWDHGHSGTPRWPPAIGAVHRFARGMTMPPCPSPDTDSAGI